MIKILYILLLLFPFIGKAQVRDTITIKNIDYVVIVDTITHKIIDTNIIEKETFFEHLYVGFTSPIKYGNYIPGLLWDCSEYGKLGVGYDIGYKTITISAYISLGRLDKRKDKIDVIYF